MIPDATDNTFQRSLSRRRFVSLALWRADVVHGSNIEIPLQIKAYTKLREMGFLETRWQYVFDNQLGGLILPVEEQGVGAVNEIHVRFYPDRIFAEYERGRAYLSHFFGPRFNANELVRRLLTGHLSESELAEFDYFTAFDRLRLEERSYKIHTDDKKIAPLLSGYSKKVGRVGILNILTSWSVLSLLGFICLSCAGFLFPEVYSVKIAIFVSFLFVLVLPRAKSELGARIVRAGTDNFKALLKLF